MALKLTLHDHNMFLGGQCLRNWSKTFLRTCKLLLNGWCVGLILTAWPGRPLHKLTEANVYVAWTSECQVSFDMIKKLLSTAPVFNYHDFHCILHTGNRCLPSNCGIGIVLSQLKDGVAHAVAVERWPKLTKTVVSYGKNCLLLWSLSSGFIIFCRDQSILSKLTIHLPSHYVKSQNHAERQLARWIGFLKVQLTKRMSIEKAKYQKINVDAVSQRP